MEDKRIEKERKKRRKKGDIREEKGEHNLLSHIST